ncbi:MAG TPA: P27 family phage terminase small subunit [Cellvibrionaceae bacterium]
MAKPGKKPLPANVHLLQGNASKKPLASLVDGIRPATTLPSPPEHLDDLAVKEWHRQGQELLKLGLICEIDKAGLEIYCVNYSLWVRSNEKLNALGTEGLVDTTPSGYKQMSVWVNIRNRAAEEIKKWLIEQGATPSARTRVSPSHPQGDMFGFGGEEETGKKDPRRFFKK